VSFSSLPEAAEYISPAQVSVIFGVSIQQLERWRRAGNGPAFVKLTPRSVVYSLAGVKEYFASRTVRTSAEGKLLVQDEPAYTPTRMGQEIDAEVEHA
jgi:hypothetical protein